MNATQLEKELNSRGDIKMTREDYLFVCLSEECAEVQKTISKALRFGLGDVNPTTNKENFVAIGDELNDIFAIIGLLVQVGSLESNFFNESAINKKQKKVIEWMEYSIKRGRLNAN